MLSGDTNKVRSQLSALRMEFAERLGLRDPKVFAPLWVIDFPLLELDEETGHYHAMHHRPSIFHLPPLIIIQSIIIIRSFIACYHRHHTINYHSRIHHHSIHHLQLSSSFNLSSLVIVQSIIFSYHHTIYHRSIFIIFIHNHSIFNLSP